MKPLPDGGTIGVAALASPYDMRSELERGVEWWEARGYRVKLAPGVHDRDDYVAGDARSRADDLHALFPEPRKSASPTSAPTLSPEEQTILATVDIAETPLDLIVTKSGLPMPKVASTLLALEMKRLVKQLPGQQFVKL